MDKLIERLMAMGGDRATADDVSRLLATDGTALLRDMMQGYFDQCAEEEHRVEVIGADGIARRTHELRRVVAEKSAKSSFDEVVELIAMRTTKLWRLISISSMRWWFVRTRRSDS